MRQAAGMGGNENSTRARSRSVRCNVRSHTANRGRLLPPTGLDLSADTSRNVPGTPNSSPRPLARSLSSCVRARARQLAASRPAPPGPCPRAGPAPQLCAAAARARLVRCGVPRAPRHGMQQQPHCGGGTARSPPHDVPSRPVARRTLKARALGAAAAAASRGSHVLSALPCHASRCWPDARVPSMPAGGCSSCFWRCLPQSLSHPFPSERFFLLVHRSVRLPLLGGITARVERKKIASISTLPRSVPRFQACILKRKARVRPVPGEQRGSPRLRLRPAEGWVQGCWRG